MNKQIEEMARTLCVEKECVFEECDSGMCEFWIEASVLHNAGYRKQSEGEWIEHGEIGAMNNAWECSVCHWKTVSFTEMKHSKYCPNCGARMKGEQ